MAGYLDIATANQVTTIRMNRPEKHNAFDETLIAELTAAFRAAGKDDAARVVVLSAAGQSFSAGADLDWMRRMADQAHDANERDALALAELMAAIDGCPKPVLGLVQGAAFGGGVGLVACCDIAIAATEATFCLSEVRLGLIPAVISPYVAAAIGARACRRYFLTAERFDAQTALNLGLVHEVVPAAEFDAASDRMLGQLLKGGPQAQRAAKDLIAHVAGARIDEKLMRDTARRIAAARASAEGKEGLAAFLAKRKPNWQ
ncbi:MAG: enoyl-CoA hydratase/isomerase family protein [Rhodospirillaceae bacterium]|nr:enoyl-CoA hydratase/isomerase family protein [Rhodospirillaceae bacterium]